MTKVPEMLEFSVGQESPQWCLDQVDHFGSAPNFIKMKTDKSLVYQFPKI